MSSDTAGKPSRRERMRAETITEIKASARRQLLDHGPSGISLRAVARDVGVSPAALYRYFDSLDALLTALCCDFYDELIDETRAAMDASPPERHLERMKSWVWTFRSWSVSHKREFELMLSFPEDQGSLSACPPNPIESPDDLDPITQKSIEHSRMCGLELAEFYRQSDGEGFDFGQVDMPELSPGLERELVEQCATLIIGDTVPLTWTYAFISGWVRVFGLVVMEAFGNLPVTENVDEFYKAQIMSMLKEFGLD
ncbi:TetR/AcrR family transcriptional regulator [Glycomyces salinus]|uniref:TetR/AcrR family transcriptional regulator n=1 Tax=Glycomyces salinus TaxID=980294 RepID=UPI0018EB4AD2|nr:TetR/AcrR family transcriptional regulator [Glycomyces salinus]